MPPKPLTVLNQELPVQNPVSSTDDSVPAQVIPIDILVEQLNLKIYDAAEGDVSLCNNDVTCLYNAKQIKAWRCVSSVCNGEGTGILPTACFEGYLWNTSKTQLAQINEAICPIIKSSTKETRGALSGQISDILETSLIEQSAYLQAFKGNADLCKSTIKDYIGAYGPNWNFKWYRALSGCNILSGKKTREEEEKDFQTWFGVEQGLAHLKYR